MKLHGQNTAMKRSNLKHIFEPSKLSSQSNNQNKTNELENKVKRFREEAYHFCVDLARYLCQT